VMRHHLIHSFDDLYIDNLHGDRRISEYAPDGRTSETIFAMQGSSVGIKVGTAVTTLVKTGQNSGAGTVHYRDFEDARASDRRSRLLSSAEDDESYSELIPNPILGLPLQPRLVTSSYLEWPKLPELFPISFPGIKTSRDPLVVDIDRAGLIKKMALYLSPDVSDEEVGREIPVAMEAGARFDAKETRAQLLRKVAPLIEHQGKTEAKELIDEYVEIHIHPYYYRPFDLRWIYWTPQTKLLDEKRDEYFFGRHPGTMELLSAQSNRRAFDPPCVSTELASLHVIERTALAFPVRTRNLMPLQSEVLQENLSDAATDYLLGHGIQETEPFFFHALATMHTALYIAENSGALLGDWPRIPLPATSELLTKSATLGRRLAELLDPESDIQLAAEWSFLARLFIAAELPEGTPDRDQRNASRLALTAGWGGAGQGATVMPRRGDARERDWTDTELERLSTLAAAQSLTLDDALTLLGPRCVDVYLNGASHWAAVPVNVWEYTLGGYQVLKKWLSYRELPLLGRPLHEEEARYFAQVVRRIAAILLMGPALDASYAAILPTATGLPTS